MKVVVIGGTGLIGSRVVKDVRAHSEEAVAASPDTGVNSLTGEGLADALIGATVVVDVSNSPSFEDTAVMEFFRTSTRNILDAEALAGVGHHVALSVVGTGTDGFSGSSYIRAKAAQERLIKESSIQYSIVHATQFFEFVWAIADAATVGDEVRLPHVLFQPIAADEVAAAVCRAALGSPVNGTVEIAGPDLFRFDDLVRRALRARHDQREVVADPEAPYYGAVLSERTLIPGDGAQLGATHFDDWLQQSMVSSS